MLIEIDSQLTQRCGVSLAGPGCSGAVTQIAAQAVDTLGTVPANTNTIQL